MRYALLFVLLTGCGASPAPQFFGAERFDITLQKIDFTVFLKDEDVEVIRLGYLAKAQRAPVPQLMRDAVEQTTGCRLIGELVPGLPGDTGEARGRVKC